MSAVSVSRCIHSSLREMFWPAAAAPLSGPANLRNHSGPCIFATCGPVLGSVPDRSGRLGHFVEYFVDQGGVEDLDLPTSNNLLGDCPEHSILAHKMAAKPISPFPARLIEGLQFACVLLSAKFGYH